MPIDRRDFFKLMAAGALPIASRMSRAAEGPSGAPTGTGYPLADRGAVIDENSGIQHEAAGPSTWNAVPMQAPDPTLSGQGPYQPTWAWSQT